MRCVRSIQDDRGAVAVTVAVLVVVFLALAAIVVDVGYLLDTRRQLQAVSEAAALAGCQELIATGGDVAAAQAVAEEYAALNAPSGPGEGFDIEQVDIDPVEGSVRVVTHQTAPGFFTNVWGLSSHGVKAAAKAQKWQLSGGRYLVPWALSVIRNVDHVEAMLVDDKGAVLDSTYLAESGPLMYSGALGAPSALGSYDVLVRIYNSYGVPEYLIDSSNNKEAPGAAVVVNDGTDLLADVSLSDDYLEFGAPLPLLTVVTAQVQPDLSVEIAGTDRVMTSADGLTWHYQITAADVDHDLESLRTYPLDVHTGKKPDKEVDAYLHLRRSTYPVAGVWTSPSVVAPGGSVGVALELNEFDPVTVAPGQTYTLRVGNTEAGNCGELNYNKIVHSPSCPPDLVIPKPGNNYYDWTAYGYEGGVHIGDVIAMSPGTSGVNTEKALDERLSNLIAGEDLIIAVPVVEKYEDKSGGEYDVIVIAFAAFKIVSYDNKGNVEGEFLQYVANPHGFLPGPGDDPNAIYAARLVNP